MAATQKHSRTCRACNQEGEPQGCKINARRLKGINSIRKRLADGSERTYYYAWKGGPPLNGEPGTPEFVASYNEAVARKVAAPEGALVSILQAYQASGEFNGSRRALGATTSKSSRSSNRHSMTSHLPR
jgi:hypothetical protein